MRHIILFIIFILIFVAVGLIGAFVEFRTSHAKRRKKQQGTQRDE